MSLNNISVTRKLWGAILLLLAAMLTIAMLAASQAASVQAESARQIALVHDLIERSAVWKGLTDTAVTRGMANVISSDPAVGELFKDNLENDTKKITAIRVEIAKAATSDEDKAAMKNVAEKGAVLVAASKKATESS
ncbi:hypothetical protein LRS03_25085 [Rhizobacter sp. J219]|uniref:hypothetical protein n=1 Tax=Rhizobacter sp. J219 TaxID=2898430 RepID=UPI002150CBC0|nr:hypothetical protein [Rhizobacter sp. J219]MCR5885954.1 hypothetical protein [Rhizobacter sp. J219]